MTYEFLKGHGTENDFVLLPDHDGTVHGDLSAERVRALCDRRAGIGGDGVLRVIRTAAYAPQWVDQAEWFMDYRNADGSVSEMCGNGVRVFVRHLVDAGLATSPVPVATRAGIKVVTVEGDQITADMGPPRLLGSSEVSVGDRTWSARHVDMGNPHAVVFLAPGETLDPHGPVGPLLDPPVHDTAEYPHGVNVEFVVREGEHHVALRVHERGSGETRSCGTGACAVMVATAEADGAARDTPYAVDVPGGRLTVTWTSADRVLLAGPAVIVARGTASL
ncbi:MAG TPA: diaminopimelate epimerase [Nocardioides sp.]|uniref:diaminopimelate epimerase n=1 Tax=Nocardioides sp. TaxID=35761 RepID=UPI002ED8518D